MKKKKPAYVLSPSLLPPCRITSLEELGALPAIPDLSMDASFFHEYIHTKNLLNDLGYDLNIPVSDHRKEGFKSSIHQLISEITRDMKIARYSESKIHIIRKLYIYDWINEAFEMHISGLKKALNDLKKGILKCGKDCTIKGFTYFFDSKIEMDPVDAYGYIKALLQWRDVDKMSFHGIVGSSSGFGDEGKNILEAIIKQRKNDCSERNLVFLYRLLVCENLATVMSDDSEINYYELYNSIRAKLSDIARRHIEQIYRTRHFSSILLFGDREYAKRLDQFNTERKKDIEGKTIQEALEIIEPYRDYLPELHESMENLEIETRRAFHDAMTCLERMDAKKTQEGLNFLAQAEEKLKSYGLKPHDEFRKLKSKLKEVLAGIRKLEEEEMKITGLIDANRFYEAEQRIAALSRYADYPGWYVFEAKEKERIGKARNLFLAQSDHLEKTSLPEAWLFWEENSHVPEIKNKIASYRAKEGTFLKNILFQGKKAYWKMGHEFVTGRLDPPATDINFDLISISRTTYRFRISGGKVELYITPRTGYKSKARFDVFCDRGSFTVCEGKWHDLGSRGELVMSLMTYEIVRNRFLKFTFIKPDQNIFSEPYRSKPLEEFWKNYKEMTENIIIVGI